MSGQQIFKKNAPARKKFRSGQQITNSSPRPSQELLFWAKCIKLYGETIPPGLKAGDGQPIQILLETLIFCRQICLKKINVSNKICIPWPSPGLRPGASILSGILCILARTKVPGMVWSSSSMEGTRLIVFLPKTHSCWLPRAF